MESVIKEQKQHLNWLVWTFRSLTALGAFFLVQTYLEIKATREGLDQMRLDRAKTETGYSFTQSEHGRRITNLETWREEVQRAERNRRNQEVLDAIN